MLEQPKPPAANPRDVGGDVRQRVRVRRVQQRRISLEALPLGDRAGGIVQQPHPDAGNHAGFGHFRRERALSPKASFPQSQGPEQVLRCQPSSMIICGGFSFPAQSEAM